MQFLTFDTYEHIEKLKRSGLSEETAKAIVDTIKIPYGDFVTKNDLANVEKALKADIEAAEQTLKAEINAVEQRLHARMADHKAEVLKWMVGGLIAQAGLLFAMLKLVH
jgi:hypothetical protein